MTRALQRLVRGTQGAGWRALTGRRRTGADRLRGLGRRCDARAGALHGGAHSPAEGSGVTIRIPLPHSERALGGQSSEGRRAGRFGL